MNSDELKSLVNRLKNREKSAISRLLTIVENGGEKANQCLELLKDVPECGYVVGVTGSPGVGKSTLVNQLSVLLAAGGENVAVLAVDPSSPISGGAILGDRIRMSDASHRDNIYIRSVASRGALGGLAPNIRSMIKVLSVAGFAWIIIETVGVGQSEIEIARLARSVVLVLAPGMGDSVQALKAGIVEIADIFVINKADYDGVQRLHKELKGILALNELQQWKPGIVETISTSGSGVEKLIGEVRRHRAWLEDNRIGGKSLIF